MPIKLHIENSKIFNCTYEILKKNQINRFENTPQFKKIVFKNIFFGKKALGAVY